VSQKNLLGISRKVTKVQEVANVNTVLKENDIMVLYGQMRDIEHFLKDH
jgi:Trk K+ transport system NAD-binding subunit